MEIVDIIRNIIVIIAEHVLLIGSGNIIFKIKDFFKNLINNRFYKTLGKDDFRAFKQRVLKRYYTENCVAKINGRTFPAFYFKSVKIIPQQNDIKKYDSFLLLESNKNVNFNFNEREHQSYKKRYFCLYSLVVAKRVIAGNRPGFMLDRLKCDKDGKVESFQVYLGTYAENIYTSHVLEYELYLAYEIFNGKNVKDCWDKIVKFMKTRNEIHRSILPYRELKTPEETKEFLKSGAGRHSLLGVQMLVLMKEKSENEERERYKLFLIRRSNSVAVAPGYYQFVPSGGFEVFCDCPQGYSKGGIRDNLSAGCAVFREYVEEIFGEKEFEGEGRGHVNEILMKNPRIKEINNMLKKGNAVFEFLGSVVDLTVLRHELSFALVIDDPDYLKNNFKGNAEAANYRFIDDVYLDNFEQKTDIWDNLHCSSAAMWKLFTESELYEKLKKDEITKNPE